VHLVGAVGKAQSPGVRVRIGEAEVVGHAAAAVHLIAQSMTLQATFAKTP